MWKLCPPILKFLASPLILSFWLIFASNCPLLGINQSVISHGEASFLRVGQ